MISDGSSVDEGLDDGDDYDDFLGGGNENENANGNEEGGEQNEQEAAEPVSVDWPLISTVEVPGDVENDNVILEKLGGADNVAKSIEEEQGVPLDVGNFAAPLVGNIHKTSHILVKARRHKVTGEVDTQLVGIVNKTVKFDNMADYHYVPPENFRGTRTIKEDLTASEENVFMPPPCFTKWLTPYPYHFEENLFSAKNKIKEDDTGNLGETILRNPNWISLNCLKFNDLVQKTAIPTEPKEGLLKSLNQVEKELLAVLKPLFEQRPMWMRPALEAQLPSHLSRVSWMQKPLSCVSYSVDNGPFRSVYVRLGYNPTEHTESKNYQVIDFRDSYFRQSGFLDNTDKSEKLDFRFKTPPTSRSQFYMFCDIEDGNVQKIITKGGQEKICGSEFGWYTKQEMHEIRQQMKIKSAQMRKLQSGPSSHLVSITNK